MQNEINARLNLIKACAHTFRDERIYTLLLCKNKGVPKVILIHVCYFLYMMEFKKMFEQKALEYYMKYSKFSNLEEIHSIHAKEYVRYCFTKGLKPDPKLLEYEKFEPKSFKDLVKLELEHTGYWHKKCRDNSFQEEFLLVKAYSFFDSFFDYFFTPMDIHVRSVGFPKNYIYNISFERLYVKLMFDLEYWCGNDLIYVFRELGVFYYKYPVLNYISWPKIKMLYERTKDGMVEVKSKPVDCHPFPDEFPIGFQF